MLGVLIITLAVTLSFSVQLRNAVSFSRKRVYSSCADIVESSPSSVSGYYVIQSSNGSLFQVYCEMGPVCGTGRRGWTRVIDQDYYTWISVKTNSCATFQYFVNQGVKYNHVCAQMFGSFAHNAECAGMQSNIDESYIRGISLTRGTPRKHIWSLAMVLDKCLNEYNLPNFIGRDYAINICDGDARGDCPFQGSSLAVNLQNSVTDDIEARVCNGITKTGRNYYSYYFHRISVVVL